MSELEISEQPIQRLTFDRKEVYERCKTDLNFLASLAMPTIVTSLFPPVFLALWDLLLKQCSIDNVFRLLLGLPRGHAKTTFIKLFALFCILFTTRKFILIICASQPKAENFLSDITDMLDEENIVAVFGNWRQSLEKDSLHLKKFSFMGRDIILAATGQGSVRGINIKNLRPDVIIMDDVQDKENAESDTESHHLLNWIQSTVMKLRDPKRCFFIYIGNKYKVPPNCVCVLERLQNNPKWVHIVTGAILADGQPLWPELHSLESLMDEFENDFNMGTPEIFFAEIMNDTDANLTSIIDLTKIPLSPFETDDSKLLCQGRFVIIDVATNKIGADDTVCGLHGIYPDAGEGERITERGKKVVLEEMVFGSFSPMDTIKEALKLCFTKGANLIAVENSAYQSSLLFWFDFVCKEIGIEESGIYFVEVLPHGKKTKRILSYFKQLLKGEVFIATNCREAIFTEALNFKPAKTNNQDDKLDMASYWQQVLEKYDHLIALPTAIGNKEFEGSKVIEDYSNCPF